MVELFLVTCLHLTGSPQGGLVSDHQPQRRPPGVGLPRQVPASVGEDQGAHHPGGGEGDGEDGGSALTPTVDNNLHKHT